VDAIDAFAYLLIQPISRYLSIYLSHMLLPIVLHHLSVLVRSFHLFVYYLSIPISPPSPYTTADGCVPLAVLLNCSFAAINQQSSSSSASSCAFGPFVSFVSLQPSTSSCDLPACINQYIIVVVNPPRRQQPTLHRQRLALAFVLAPLLARVVSSERTKECSVVMA